MTKLSEKQKILITGGSGLLAVNWAIVLRDSCNVFISINERVISLKGVSKIFLDLNSIDEIIGAIQKNKFDLVIHTAGIANVEMAEADKSLADQVNSKFAENVSVACENQGISFIHISTDHLFSGESSFSDEQEQINPKNAYGISKAKAEDLVLQSNKDSLIIRTNFFGWGPSYRQSFSDFVIGSLRSNKKLTLFNDVQHTPIIISKLVKISHELLKNNCTGIYNVVGDDRLSKYEFGSKLAKVFGLNSDLIIEGSIEDVPFLVNRPLDMSLSNKKVTKVLGSPVGGIDHFINELKDQETTGLASELHNI